MRLSKREIMLLIFLMLILIAFIEYRFVITPSIDRYYELIDTDNSLQEQIDEININLATRERNAAERNNNLDKIDELQNPFIDSLKPDVLLYYTYDLLVDNDFDTSQISFSTVNITTPEIYRPGVDRITYRIKQVVDEYNDLRESSSNDGQFDEIPPMNLTGAQIEKFSVQINAQGSYSQILNVMDALSDLDRTIMISQLNLTRESQDGLMPISFSVDYYGIDKAIDVAIDEFSIWQRSHFQETEENPFRYIESEEIIEDDELIEDEIIEDSDGIINNDDESVDQ